MSEKIEKLFEKMDKRLDKQDDMMLQLINMVGKTNQRFDTLGNDVSIIKESVLRVEQGEPKNITAVLMQINNKLDEKINSHEYELASMNSKISDLDSDLKLIKRVLTNQ